MTSHRPPILSAAVASIAISLCGSVFADDGACQSACKAGGSAHFIAAGDAQAAQTKSAEELLAAYNAVELPKLDPAKRDDQDYIREHIQRQNDALSQRVELGREFVFAYPDHPEARKIAAAFIQAQIYNLQQAAEARRDIKALLAREGLPEDLAITLEVLDGTAMLMAERDPDGAWEHAQKLHARHPGEDRVAALMLQAAQASGGEKGIERYRQAVAAFPDSERMELAKGKIRAAEGIGEPFEISFTDALTGREITTSDLRGKVVVIDFWATWCGPCIAQMPKLKELYSQYKDQGVEFIGVSLDQPEEQGGKEALLKYCRENDINWPQFYQGNGWDSEFSRGWGINAIPAIFIVDADGRLYSTSAGRELEMLIPKLIAKRDGTTNGAARTAGADANRASD